eukprot:1294747-Rhodomonas_salina.2
MSTLMLTGGTGREIAQHEPVVDLVGQRGRPEPELQRVRAARGDEVVGPGHVGLVGGVGDKQQVLELRELARQLRDVAQPDVGRRGPRDADVARPEQDIDLRGDHCAGHVQHLSVLEHGRRAGADQVDGRYLGAHELPGHKPAVGKRVLCDVAELEVREDLLVGVLARRRPDD